MDIVQRRLWLCDPPEEPPKSIGYANGKEVSEHVVTGSRSALILRKRDDWEEFRKTGVHQVL